MSHLLGVHSILGGPSQGVCVCWLSHAAKPDQVLLPKHHLLLLPRLQKYQTDQLILQTIMALQLGNIREALFPRQASIGQMSVVCQLSVTLCLISLAVQLPLLISNMSCVG